MATRSRSRSRSSRSISSSQSEHGGSLVHIPLVVASEPHLKQKCVPHLLFLSRCAREVSIYPPARHVVTSGNKLNEGLEAHFHKEPD
jgi:hypothetical protein